MVEGAGYVEECERLLGGFIAAAGAAAVLSRGNPVCRIRSWNEDRASC